MLSEHSPDLRLIEPNDFAWLLGHLNPDFWPPENLKVLRAYYVGETLTQAAKTAGMSRSRANDIVRKLLRMTRHPSRWQRLSDISRQRLA